MSVELVRLQDCVDHAVEVLGEDIMALSPRDVMLLAMRTALKAGWIFKAADIADTVAPYIHSKLTSVTTDTANVDESRTDDELLDELSEIRNRSRAGDRARVVAATLQGGSNVLGYPGTEPGEAAAGAAPSVALRKA
jgi:hypothetical protein